MPFAVFWSIPARNNYMLAWMMAADQRGVESARDEIDQLLSSDPQANGTHVAEGLWKVSVPPLLVHFDIDPAAGRVNVTQLDLVT